MTTDLVEPNADFAYPADLSSLSHVTDECFKIHGTWCEFFIIQKNLIALLIAKTWPWESRVAEFLTFKIHRLCVISCESLNVQAEELARY